MPGVTIIEEENVPETVDVQKTMESMINLDGASLVFPTSFGYYDPHMLKMCEKYPDVQFRHCGGMWDEAKHPKNAGSYFGYIGMGQYLNGIVAGHTSKTKKLGFIAAKPIPQVLININSFTMGARTVDPTITTQVIFTGDWSLPVKEAEATNSLVDQGIDVVTCHVDSPKVVIETAERRGIYTCGYHADQSKLAPKGYLTGAEWNWATVYKMFVEKAQAGEPLPNFVRGGLAEGFVKTSPYGPAVGDAAQGAGGRDQGRHDEGRLRRVQGPAQRQPGQPGRGGRAELRRDRDRARIDRLPDRRRDRLDLLNAEDRPVSVALDRALEPSAPSLRADLEVRLRQAAEGIAIPLLALLLSAVIFSLFLLVQGYSPLQFFTLMWTGGFGSSFSLQNSLQRATPLLLTALCVAIPARLGLVVIGGEGALVLGGLMAAAVAVPLLGLPAPLVWIAMGLAGALGGAICIGLVGALAPLSRRQRDHLQPADRLYRDRDHEPAGRGAACAIRPASTSRRPCRSATPTCCRRMPGMDVHWGLAIGVVACIAAWLLMGRTTYGFAARITGGNPRAAMLQGLPVGQLMISACALAGACAGLAGMIEVAAVQRQRQRLAGRGLRLHRHPGGLPRPPQPAGDHAGGLRASAASSPAAA